VANTGREGEAMGQFGRIASVADLPSPREFKVLVKAAAAQARVRAEATPPVARRAAEPVPAGTELQAALQGHAAARRGFESLTPGRQREYVEWIAEAKREATRARRIAQALEWLAEGKSRNWKYVAC
jgi:uncharacterized protein YdeI (YjbR/CyaY-like superfamily)